MIDSIDEAVKKMAQHTKDNPKHGPNCSCKDEFLRSVRRFLKINPDYWDEFQYIAAVMLRSHRY